MEYKSNLQTCESKLVKTYKNLSNKIYLNIQKTIREIILNDLMRILDT